MNAKKTINEFVANMVLDAFSGEIDLLDSGTEQANMIASAAATRGAPGPAAPQSSCLAVASGSPVSGPSAAFLPLSPAGIAINPDALDFGDLRTMEQLGNAGRFARMVNAIPVSDMTQWTPSGATTWKVWQMVLDGIELPYGSSGYEEVTRMKANLNLSGRSDPMGATFYFTDYTPKKFWEPANAAAWKPFSLSSGDSVASRAGANDVTAISGAANLNALVTQVQLQRSWWDPWLFSSRNWRFAPGSLSSQLSDGQTPPSGSMPMYATSLVVAKDVTVTVGDAGSATVMETARKATDLNFGPFALRSHDQGLSSTGSGIDVEISRNELHSTGMQIIGFLCCVLPQSPNSTDDLYWGSAGSFQITNKGGFVARFSVSWTMGGNRTMRDSGDFPAPNGRVIDIPPGAEDIVAKVEIMTRPLPEKWSTVATKAFLHPQELAFKLSGTTVSPELKPA